MNSQVRRNITNLQPVRGIAPCTPGFREIWQVNCEPFLYNQIYCAGTPYPHANLFPCAANSNLYIYATDSNLHVGATDRHFYIDAADRNFYTTATNVHTHTNPISHFYPHPVTDITHGRAGMYPARLRHRGNSELSQRRLSRRLWCGLRHPRTRVSVAIAITDIDATNTDTNTDEPLACDRRTAAQWRF